MALELRSLTCRFGRHLALDRVSLRVEPGDTYGLIGHNGAGKTTAIRIALGLLPARAGSVVVDGFDAARFPREARARMGGLIESPGFHPAWDGRANLMLLARLQGLAAAAARSEVSRMLELVGLPGLEGKPVRAYSHGMRQRLGIAQALLGDPRYLLLDEPTDGLDPEGIAEMRALLARLTREQGRAVLISSHQLHELTGLCNRVGLMRNGQLLVEDRLEVLLASDGGRYELRTGDDGAAAEELRRAGLAVRPRPGGGLEVELGGRDPGAVLRGLVESGREVLAFAPLAKSLEEVYLGLRDGAEPLVRPPERAATGAPSERMAPRWPVWPVWRVFAHEVARWRRSPGTWILLALPAAVAALRVGTRLVEAEGYTAEVEQGALASTTTVTAFEGMAIALKAGVPCLAVALLGITSQTVAGELGRGTLRNVLLRPLTRVQLVLGKALGALAVGAVGYALVLAAGFGAAGLAFDFEDLTEVLPNGERYAYLSASELLAPLADAIAAPLLPLCAYAGLGFLISAAVRGPVLALGLAMALYVALDWGRGLALAADRWLELPVGVEAWLPSAYLSSPFRDTSYVEYYNRFALGESNVAYRYDGTDVAVPLLWALAAFALSALLVRRRHVP